MPLAKSLTASTASPTPDIRLSHSPDKSKLPSHSNMSAKRLRNFAIFSKHHSRASTTLSTILLIALPAPAALSEYIKSANPPPMVVKTPASFSDNSFHPMLSANSSHSVRTVFRMVSKPVCIAVAVASAAPAIFSGRYVAASDSAAISPFNSFVFRMLFCCSSVKSANCEARRSKLSQLEKAIRIFFIAFTKSPASRGFQPNDAA